MPLPLQDRQVTFCSLNFVSVAASITGGVVAGAVDALDVADAVVDADAEGSGSSPPPLQPDARRARHTSAAAARARGPPSVCERAGKSASGIPNTIATKSITYVPTSSCRLRA